MTEKKTFIVHFMLLDIYFNCIIFTYVFVKAVKFGYLQFKLNHVKYDLNTLVIIFRHCVHRSKKYK